MTATHYTGWNQPLRVQLTGTTNVHLKDRLPLVGMLTVHETRTDGSASPHRVTFRELKEDGTITAAVHVDDPTFTYPPVEEAEPGHPHAPAGVTMRDVAATETKRHAEMLRRQEDAETTGNYRRYDEYAADVNEGRAADLGTALDLADHAGTLLAGILGDSATAESIGPKLNCLEADHLAVAMHLLGQTDAAVTLMTFHVADVDGCDWHEHLMDATGPAMVAHLAAAAETFTAARLAQALEESKQE